MSHDQQPIGLIKEGSDSSQGDFYLVSLSLHVGGIRPKKVWRQRRRLLGEKHCRMISGLKEIPRGILSPSLEKKRERWVTVTRSWSFPNRGSCIYTGEPQTARWWRGSGIQMYFVTAASFMRERWPRCSTDGIFERKADYAERLGCLRAALIDLWGGCQRTSDEYWSVSRTQES